MKRVPTVLLFLLVGAKALTTNRLRTTLLVRQDTHTASGRQGSRWSNPVLSEYTKTHYQQRRQVTVPASTYTRCFSGLQTPEGEQPSSTLFGRVCNFLRFPRRLGPRVATIMLLCFMLLPVLVPPPAIASVIPYFTAPAVESGITAVPVAATTLEKVAASKPLSLGMEIKLSARLVYAALGGAAVGWERSTKERPAGVRTMSLVSLGAAVFTLCSMYGFLAVQGPHTKFDPSRMASNVASGVGFIGAGVITNNNNLNQARRHGLSTAAAIWVAAAVGVASGVGLYFLAGVGSLSTIAILQMGRVKEVLAKKRRKVARNGSLLQDKPVVSELDIFRSTSTMGGQDVSEISETTKIPNHVETIKLKNLSEIDMFKAARQNGLSSESGRSEGMKP